MKKSDRINQLKNVEVPCYSLAMHVVKDVNIATELTKKVLVELYKQDAFFHMDDIQKNMCIKKTFATVFSKHKL